MSSAACSVFPPRESPGQSIAQAAAGQPGVEDEEEKARRLARAALGGAPQLAIAGPVLAESATGPMGEAGDGGAPNADAAAAAQLATARQYRDGGAPAGGAPLAASQPEEGGSSGGELAGNLTGALIGLLALVAGGALAYRARRRRGLAAVAAGSNTG